MVSQMMHGENEQILGMAAFMRASGMHVPLQRRDWTAFARRYNGPAFARNRYHEKLAAAHTRLSTKGLPDLDVRAVQLLLTYHGFDPGKIDGIVGGRTRTAIAAFTTKHGLSVTGDHKDLRAALRKCYRRRRTSRAPALPRKGLEPRRIFDSSNHCSHTSGGTPDQWTESQDRVPGTPSPISSGPVEPS
jgi:peptidoglycan hydrolase-like protein with peptidoglycan-binding domain